MAHLYGLISADSHVVEPVEAFTAHLEPAFRDRAPQSVRRDDGADLLVVPGLADPITYGIGQAAGLRPERFKSAEPFGRHPSGHNPYFRKEAQEDDGVDAEILFATAGMAIARYHPDPELQAAYFRAYNRWLAEYCAAIPDRVFGLALTPLCNPDTAIAEIEWAKTNGFVGLMMPGEPADPAADGDFDAPAWDPVWECAAGLGMVLSVHIATSATVRNDQRNAMRRGNNLSRYLVMPRQIQDIVSLLVLSGVLERHPNLKIAGSECDVSWIPHWKYRLDKAYRNHPELRGDQDLSEPPSYYIDRQLWATFQTDWCAFREIEVMPAHGGDRIMWANDYPHSDSTWPGSPEFLREHTSELTGAQRAAVLRNNCIECYGLPLPKAPDDIHLRDDGMPYEMATHRPLHGPTMVGRV